MKRVAKFQEGGEVVEPPFVRRRQAREEAARAAEAEDDGRGARRERLRNFFRLGPRTQEEADILEAYRTNRDVSEIRREREAGGRAAVPAPAPAPAAPAPAAPSRGRQVQPPPRTAPATPAPTADYEERMRRGSLPAGRSAAPGPMGDYSERAAAGAAARPRPAQRQAPRPRYSEADIARIRSVMEGGDIQPEQPGFFERLGLRRTNETGMEPGTIEHRRNYLGSGAADTNVSYNKKGGLLKAKAPAKKTAMKKGGAVKAPTKKMKSGGKVAPKKMMKGGMTSKPKKMMGGGKAMYAKGGMAKGCK